MNPIVAVGTGRAGVAAGANAEEFPLGVATGLATTLPIECHSDRPHTAPLGVYSSRVGPSETRRVEVSRQ